MATFLSYLWLTRRVPLKRSFNPPSASCGAPCCCWVNKCHMWLPGCLCICLTVVMAQLQLLLSLPNFPALLDRFSTPSSPPLYQPSGINILRLSKEEGEQQHLSQVVAYSLDLTQVCFGDFVAALKRYAPQENPIAPPVGKTHPHPPTLGCLFLCYFGLRKMSTKVQIKSNGEIIAKVTNTDVPAQQEKRG